MNSSNYANANHVTQSCNSTHLIYGAGGTPPPALTPQQQQKQIPSLPPKHRLSMGSPDETLEGREREREMRGSGETMDTSKRLWQGGEG